MGWSIEVKSIERKRDYSYECILRSYEQDIRSYGYKKAYCELIKNYEFAVEELLKSKGDYEKFICQINESFKIMVATYKAVHDKKNASTDLLFLSGVGEKKEGKFVFHPCDNKEIIKKSVERSVKDYSDMLKKEFHGKNEALQVYLAGSSGKKSALEEFVQNLILLADEFIIEYRKKYGSVDTKKVYREIIDFAQDLIQPRSKWSSLTNSIVESDSGIFNWVKYPDYYTVDFKEE